MNSNNLILATDSYKLCHWNQYPSGTEAVYSYLESRQGATYPYTVFFGLQSILKRYLVGNVVKWPDLKEAFWLAHAHFGRTGLLNDDGWSHIISKHGGRLPLRIKAVPEGTVVPTGNVLMTVENTDPACYWLTNAVESLLTHVWYPSTVATLSYYTKQMIRGYLDRTGGSQDPLKFMLHDFGYRGASSHESASIGAAAHLVNFVGSDTLPGMELAIEDYSADPDSLAFSVPATEHSVMTALGEEGEFDVVTQLLDNYPTGVLSVVADSYDIYRFVRELGSTYRKRILDREGVFVVRPDSVTEAHPTPESLVVWVAEKLWLYFGGHTNDQGFRVIDPHVRILWGDGIDPEGIHLILSELVHHCFAAENMATFGMGGGLLQKVDRDTQRFAFKASAIKRGGEWHNIHKRTLNKDSKAGRMRLVTDLFDRYYTIPEVPGGDDLLETVFEDGVLTKEYTFDQVRENAAHSCLVVA